MPIYNQIERSEEIDDILGRTPNKILNWGMSVIFIVCLLLLAASWFIKYPEVLSSNIELVTTVPPIDIIVKATGRIDSIAISNNEIVFENQFLALIENPANFNDIKRLSGFLDYSISDSSHFDSIVIFGNYREEMELGELQTPYSQFVASLEKYTSFNQIKYFERKIELMLSHVTKYKIFYDKTNSQKQTLELDLIITKKDYERHKTLFSNNAISEVEFERSYSKYLNKKQSVEAIQSSLSNINIQITELENEILEFNLINQRQSNQLHSELCQMYNNLKAQLDIWKQKYLLRSPIDGKCVFTKYWSENQNISIGDNIMTVIPSNPGSIVGKLLLPFKGSGKVKEGQRVNIQLFSYPFMEFGILDGIVQNISSIPNEDFYYVEVSLSNGMKTTYGVDITFSQKMQGSAEIITEDVRLFHRLIQPIKNILKSRIS